MARSITSKQRHADNSTVRVGRTSRAVAMVALLAWGCEQQDLTRQYEFIVRVSSEPGRAVEAASASLEGKELGVSDGDGAITITVRGREGDVLPIEIGCPSGHRAPTDPVQVPLRHVGNDIKPEFAAVCTPTSHSIVVAVRAERGPNLPLLHLGRELARTDSSGAAHLVLDVASEEVVELVLDTTHQPTLRPKSPVLRIQPGRSDEITAIAQDFTVAKPPAPRVVTPPRRGPVRID
jgi:hypothetical protein